MDPMIEEFCRVRTPQDIRPDVLKRWQTYLRTQIQPKLDDLEELERPAVVRKGATR